MLLKMLVKGNIIHHIQDYKTSNEIWVTLKDLYETKNTNCVLFLKRKILSIMMEKNAYVILFISRITKLKDRLGDIEEKVYSTDLVTITLNGMIDDYQMFITWLTTREKAPTFEELIGILMQEEEKHKN